LLSIIPEDLLAPARTLRSAKPIAGECGVHPFHRTTAEVNFSLNWM
jgi:hypothetical protein